MALKIEINNLNKKRSVNQNTIKRTILHILKCFKKKDACIEITFVTNSRIKALNKRYMNRNRPTDVLSFLLDEGAGTNKKDVIIADIYISSDMAYDNTKRFKTTFEEEILLYAIHGILHIIGFRDKTAKEKNKIRNLEESFLKVLWKNKGLLKV